MYVEVRGPLRVPGEPWRPGKIRAWVRWEDGVWACLEPTVNSILCRVAAATILLTATGPAIPADSPRAAVVLACDPFYWPGSVLKTDIPPEPLPLDPGVGFW